jgi:hypothetical protein
MELRVPLIFCIDVEPDEHVYMPEDPSPWSGFEALAAQSVGLRARLAALTGEPARFTWSLRLDPQIAEAYGDPAWIIDRHRDFFDEARSLGDAVGVHPHTWRLDHERRVWVADHEDPEWIDQCVEMSYSAYESRFQAPPPHQRFGGRFISERVLATAERLGARFDLTLEPGEPPDPPGERLGGIWVGEIPDYANVPRVPYHPDRSDFRRPSTGNGVGLWTIPLSSGRMISRRRELRLAQRVSHPVRSAQGVSYRLGRRLRRARRMSAGDRRPPYRLLKMYGDWQRPADLWHSAFASLTELEHRYLAFAIRSDMQPLVERFMGALFEHPEARRLVFTTPDDALLRLGLLRDESIARIPPARA